MAKASLPAGKIAIDVKGVAQLGTDRQSRWHLSLLDR
jgi:hypothetical protein